MAIDLRNVRSRTDTRTVRAPPCTLHNLQGLSMSTNPVKADVLRRKQKIRFSAVVIPVLKPTTPAVVKAPPSKLKKPFPIPVKSIPVM